MEYEQYMRRLYLHDTMTSIEQRLMMNSDKSLFVIDVTGCTWEQGLLEIASNESDRKAFCHELFVLFRRARYYFPIPLEEDDDWAEFP